MSRLPNPFRRCILLIGLALARFGLVNRERAVRTADLAWPRIVTGIARMSKNAVDVAMVGVAVGTVGITGVGYASPYWGIAFCLGGGVAGGTIALVSQRFGAGADEDLGTAVRASALIVVVATLPITAIFWTVPTQLVSILSDEAVPIALGAAYLKVVGLGVPFAALNLVGSRVLVGADDAYTAMVLRASGAVINAIVNGALIFGLGMGVEGAALGTVVSNVVVTGAFVVGLSRGRFPGIGEFPVQVDPFGPFVHRPTISSLVNIGLPVVGRNLTWTFAEFPMLAILSAFGPTVVAAFVIARRIWGIMNTPGWGFGLASSSLVGQSLGVDDEETAEAYGHEIVRYAVATYVVSAVIVAIFAERLVLQFVARADDPAVPIAVSLVYAACFAVVLQGVTGGAAGALNASGDTRWPFYSQFLGMFCGSIPLAYLGANGATLPLLGEVAPLGIAGIYLAFLAETGVPAVINYYRFSTGRWKAISRTYRPGVVADD